MNHTARGRFLGGKVSADNENNVTQIRDILFGGQMRDYEKRFQELHQQLESELERLRQDADKRFAALDKRLADQLEKLTRQQRQEVSDRTGAIDSLESRLLEAARIQRSEINKAAETLGHDLETLSDRLHSTHAALETALTNQASQADAALNRAQRELRVEKVGREDLAALFTEFAMRLKGEFELPRSK